MEPVWNEGSGGGAQNVASLQSGRTWINLRGKDGMMAEADQWLIVGLGNPGTEYQHTRHNVGRDVIEAIAASDGARFSNHRSRTQIARVRLGGVNGSQTVLALSKTFMNVSGPPVVGLAKSLGIPVERTLVVHDDLDLPAHDLRLKRGGGSGGHNGLKSITAVFGDGYARLRIGIGRPPGSMDPARFVLTPIPKQQREEWDVTIQLAADVVQQVVVNGFSAAQMELHSRS